ncbi:tyrosine-type recombinase/integrase [Membranihabitans maritimus]|uniref:tyrosine-type recombinase/integrase n=1 Tax=Membranihabitans maritimus TaxID=2904244 RepID=UPI001F491242|nr:site-specific integrase [Membranihabitans maritimus]
MIREYHITIVLDKRRKKANGKYPVKLRVFTPEPRKQKLLATKFEYSKEEFKSIWETTKPRKKYKDERLKLQALENKAYEVANQMEYFTFEAFERILYGGRKSIRNRNVISYYENLIEEYKANGQIGTADSYGLSLKSLLNYHNKNQLSFAQIDKKWLEGYERYMTETKGCTATTVGIYLRPLRRVFNLAIEDKIIPHERYPFGRGKYQIPRPKGAKKALTLKQLSTLFHAEPENPQQEKAKDFWFFSYNCNGMNIKDIALLQYKNIQGDVLIFHRAKTSKTKKDSEPVQVFLTPFAKSIIEKYGDKDQFPNNYIFPIIDQSLSAAKQRNQIKNFVRFINQHIVRLADSVGIKERVSTYWARHSFATNAIRNGASMEFVKDALNHSSMNTTTSYFAGFLPETQKEITNKLMDL